jgi:hypothetical protein
VLIQVIVAKCDRGFDDVVEVLLQLGDKGGITTYQLSHQLFEMFAVPIVQQSSLK